VPVTGQQIECKEARVPTAKQQVFELWSATFIDGANFAIQHQPVLFRSGSLVVPTQYVPNNENPKEQPFKLSPPMYRELAAVPRHLFNSGNEAEYHDNDKAVSYAKSSHLPLSRFGMTFSTTCLRIYEFVILQR